MNNLNVITVITFVVLIVVIVFPPPIFGQMDYETSLDNCGTYYNADFQANITENHSQCMSHKLTGLTSTQLDSLSPSYLKGNNTVANVSAIVDLNDEKGWYSKDNPLRYTKPNEYEWTNEDIQCKLYHECNNDDNKQKIVAIEVFN